MGSLDEARPDAGDVRQRKEQPRQRPTRRGRKVLHAGLTFDMSGGRKQAQPAGGRPLDGGVRRPRAGHSRRMRNLAKCWQAEALATHAVRCSAWRPALPKTPRTNTSPAEKTTRRSPSLRTVRALEPSAIARVESQRRRRAVARHAARAELDMKLSTVATNRRHAGIECSHPKKALSSPADEAHWPRAQAVRHGLPNVRHERRSKAAKRAWRTSARWRG